MALPWVHLCSDGHLSIPGRCLKGSILPRAWTGRLQWLLHAWAGAGGQPLGSCVGPEVHSACIKWRSWCLTDWSVEWRQGRACSRHQGPRDSWAAAAQARRELPTVWSLWGMSEARAPPGGHAIYPLRCPLCLPCYSSCARLMIIILCLKTRGGDPLPRNTQDLILWPACPTCLQLFKAPQGLRRPPLLTPGRNLGLLTLLGQAWGKGVAQSAAPRPHPGLLCIPRGSTDKAGPLWAVSDHGLPASGKLGGSGRCSQGQPSQGWGGGKQC